MCPHCGLGCTTTPGARYGELRRVVSRYSREVNKMFLCDRGRYGYEYVNAPQRIRAARVAWRPASQVAGQASAGARREQALDAAAVLLRGRRAIGIGSPRASLEDNYALRALVGADRFYLGLSESDHDLVGDVVSSGRRGLAPRRRWPTCRRPTPCSSSARTSRTRRRWLDLTVRTWLRLRPTAQEERVHIRRWNDAAIGRAKRREPSALWIAAPHAGKLDELAAEAWHAAPDDIARLALALAHEVDPASPAVADLSDAERERVARWAEALRASRRP